MPLQPASEPKWSAQSSSSHPTPTPPRADNGRHRLNRMSTDINSTPNLLDQSNAIVPKILFPRDDVLKDFYGDKFGAALAPSAINVVSIRQSLSDLQRINKNTAGVDAFVIQIGTNDLETSLSLQLLWILLL